MSEAKYIIDVTPQNINEVVQASLRVPVLLDFWAEWCEPCKALAPVLEKLAHEYAGQFLLARVDADANQMLAQQLAVRTIPALKLIMQGQLAGELDGAQPESAIRAMLESYLGKPEPVEEEPEAPDFAAEIARARQMGAHDQAIAALQSAIQEFPQELSYQTLMAEVLMDVDRLDDALAVLDNIKDEKVTLPGRARLFFIQELQSCDSPESLQYRVAEDPRDMAARYFLAATCVLSGEYEEALELLLEVVQRDREFKEDGARLAILKLIELLDGDPAAARYRRRLFACLH